MKSPLTGRSDTERLAVINPKSIADLWMDAMQINIGNDFVLLPSIEYWHCKTTGLRWYTPPEAAGDGGLYAQLEKYDWYYTEGKWEHQKALDVLTPGERVLEVGVGFGYFLREAKNRGAQAFGVELNPSAAERVRNMGFEIFETDLVQLSEKIDNVFDVVCAFQVLEHVSDPRVFLEGMLAVLRPGGRMILSVPNAAVMRRIDPSNNGLLNQPPHHMSHWDAGVFRALEKLLPVRVLSIDDEPLADYHVDWFITGYLRGLFAPLGSLVNRILFNRITTAPISWLLHKGVRLRVPGHTFLVVLEKKI